MEMTLRTPPRVCRLLLRGALTVQWIVLPFAVLAEETPPEVNVPPDHAERMAAGARLFKAKLRSVLVDRCLGCHGGGKKRADFDLSTRSGLLSGGRSGPAVRPGDREQSLLYRLVARREEPFMPHREAPLPQDTVEWIGRWIDLGAPYDSPLVGEGPGGAASFVSDRDRDWWSFSRLRAVAPPRVDGAGDHPIDAFVVSAQRDHSVGRSDPASPRVLLRRLYLDLTGLPPTPGELEEFVRDPSELRYREIVDRLLASPAHGERWARHWLDVARFAESHGFEHDYDRKHAYHYRDFVIRALYENLPYDQFVRWQLAGDEFAPGEPLAMMATGFLGAGVFPTQITQKEVERTRYDALDDMLSTASSAFLGLTVGCARCHDHKFDPIPTRDYYRMLATFTTTVRSEIDVNLAPEEYRREKEEFDAKHAPFVSALRDFEESELPVRFERWLADDAKRAAAEGAWSVLQWETAVSKGGATLRALEDGSLLAEGKNPEFDVYTLVARTNLQGIRALRLEALSHPSLVKGGPGRAANGNIGLGSIRVTAAPVEAAAGTPQVVTLVRPRATFEQNGGNLALAASLDDDPRSGWAVDPQFGKNHSAVFEFDRPVGFESGTTLSIELEFTVNHRHNIGRPRIAVTTLSGTLPLEGDGIPDAVARGLRELRDGAALTSLEKATRDALANWYRERDERWLELKRAVDAHLEGAPKPSTTKMMVCSEGVKPMRHHTQGADFFDQTYFLKRGDTDQKDGVAEPGFLSVLTDPVVREDRWRESPPEGARTSYRRRSFANWITDVEHGAGALLARVAVNRVWQHHMGRGLVATPNDFGRQGERPSHPELLEWLATELVQSGWDLRHIHRIILTSQTFRQSSTFVDENFRLDPDNRFYWRFSPRRLEAEAIRDLFLAVSGRLDRTLFGPGTLDPNHRRRSLYFTVKRSRLVAMLQVFDAPQALVSLPVRAVTTTAPQALLLMNGDEIRRSAEAFANRLLDANPTATDAEVVARAYRIALSRAPTPAEHDRAVSFLAAQRKTYASEAERPALADFCQVLMSLGEFVYVR